MKHPETEIAERSLSLFGIIGTIRKIRIGLDAMYRVTAETGQVFALRVSQGLPIRQFAAFHVEAAWIDALAGSRWLGVPQVQRTKTGELVGQVRDDDGVLRPSMLLAWIPGRRCFQPQIKHARLLGQMAGGLHQHARTFIAPGDIKSWDVQRMCFMPNDPQDGLAVIAPKAAEKVQTVYLFLEQLVAELDSDEIGLINGDLGLHNVLWHKGEVGLVDFNDTGIGPYAFCLGRLVGRMRLHENGSALVAALLDGYRDVTPLPTAYEQWGSLFELVADIFRLNYSAARAVARDMPLRDSEQQILDEIDSRLARLNL